MPWRDGDGDLPPIPLAKALQSRDFFKHYTERTRQAASGGEVTVTPIELIGETARP